MINPITSHKGDATMARKASTTTKPEVDETKTEPETFSAKDLAQALDIDQKAFRRWLRNHTQDRANKGGRWVFTAESKEAILAAYNAKSGTDATID